MFLSPSTDKDGDKIPSWLSWVTNHKDTEDTEIDRSCISETYHTKNKRAALFGA
ncbi:unknown protein [Microcystis aeruginosa NIES-843]|uniref:Uncharacterized protein n=1 Tax=Microcystis aeruginosa (strain NIES-843 / IAM M-2473) TaxID=449447 RepID=B0JX78_MICAN|nr:unknown protein [Microcystis aeruginosa NIES-843]